MKIFAAALFASLLCAAPSFAAPSAEAQNVLKPADNGATLSNRGMGWVFHFYDNVPTSYGSRLEFDDTLQDFAGADVVYLRIPWSYIEPQEGKFNWSVVDSVAQRWIDKGKRVAFRFSSAESWMRYATPEWVQKAGAKGYNFSPGKEAADGPFWEPDYDDAIFLSKLDNFLAAAAARYDGNPNVEFFDVGSFGVWGEGHTLASTLRKYPASTVIRHIDLHLKHFKKTLLAANDDFSFQGDETIEYSRAHNLALRDDSILVQGGDNAYFHAKMAQDFWPTRPVILESEHYGPSRDAGHWKDGAQYLQAIEEYHASYASIHWWPREFQNENRALIARINKRLGYRIQLRQISWPKSVRADESFSLDASWRNAGVAPCYGGAFPTLTLKTKSGAIAATFTDENFDARDLQTGAPDAAPQRAQSSVFTLPFFLKPGQYDAFISMGTRDGTPQIELPLDGNDGKRRYKIGAFVVGDALG